MSNSQSDKDLYNYYEDEEYSDNDKESSEASDDEDYSISEVKQKKHKQKIIKTNEKDRIIRRRRRRRKNSLGLTSDFRMELNVTTNNINLRNRSIQKDLTSKPVNRNYTRKKLVKHNKKKKRKPRENRYYKNHLKNMQASQRNSNKQQLDYSNKIIKDSDSSFDIEDEDDQEEENEHEVDVLSHRTLNTHQTHNTHNTHRTTKTNKTKTSKYSSNSYNTYNTIMSNNSIQIEEANANSNNNIYKEGTVRRITRTKNQIIPVKLDKKKAKPNTIITYESIIKNYRSAEESNAIQKNKYNLRMQNLIRKQVYFSNEALDVNFFYNSSNDIYRIEDNCFNSYTLKSLKSQVDKYLDYIKKEYRKYPEYLMDNDNWELNELNASSFILNESYKTKLRKNSVDYSNKSVSSNGFDNRSIKSGISNNIKNNNNNNNINIKNKSKNKKGKKHNKTKNNEATKTTEFNKNINVIDNQEDNEVDAYENNFIFDRYFKNNNNTVTSNLSDKEEFQYEKMSNLFHYFFAVDLNNKKYWKDIDTYLTPSVYWFIINSQYFPKYLDFLDEELYYNIIKISGLMIKTKMYKNQKTAITAKERYNAVTEIFCSYIIDNFYSSISKELGFKISKTNQTKYSNGIIDKESCYISNLYENNPFNKNDFNIFYNNININPNSNYINNHFNSNILNRSNIKTISGNINDLPLVEKSLDLISNTNINNEEKLNKEEPNINKDLYKSLIGLIHLQDKFNKNKDNYNSNDTKTNNESTTSRIKQTYGSKLRDFINTYIEFMFSNIQVFPLDSKEGVLNKIDNFLLTKPNHPETILYNVEHSYNKFITNNINEDSTNTSKDISSFRKNFSKEKFIRNVYYQKLKLILFESLFIPYNRYSMQDDENSGNESDDLNKRDEHDNENLINRLILNSKLAIKTSLFNRLLLLRSENWFNLSKQKTVDYYNTDNNGNNENQDATKNLVFLNTFNDLIMNTKKEKMYYSKDDILSNTYLKKLNVLGKSYKQTGRNNKTPFESLVNNYKYNQNIAKIINTKYSNFDLLRIISINNNNENNKKNKKEIDNSKSSFLYYYNTKNDSTTTFIESYNNFRIKKNNINENINTSNSIINTSTRLKDNITNKADKAEKAEKEKTQRMIKRIFNPNYREFFELEDKTNTNKVKDDFKYETQNLPITTTSLFQINKDLLDKTTIKEVIHYLETELKHTQQQNAQNFKVLEKRISDYQKKEILKYGKFGLNKYLKNSLLTDQDLTNKVSIALEEKNIMNEKVDIEYGIIAWELIERVKLSFLSKSSSNTNDKNDDICLFNNNIFLSWDNIINMQLFKEYLIWWCLSMEKKSSLIKNNNINTVSISNFNKYSYYIKRLSVIITSSSSDMITNEQERKDNYLILPETEIYLYNKKRNYYIEITNINDSSECFICRNPICLEINQLVYCSNCSLVAHQQCYGIKIIPKGPWYCNICKYLFDKQGEVECFLCCQKGGAMIPTDILKDSDLYKNVSKFWRTHSNYIGKKAKDNFNNNCCVSNCANNASNNNNKNKRKYNNKKGSLSNLDCYLDINCKDGCEFWKWHNQIKNEEKKDNDKFKDKNIQELSNYIDKIISEEQYNYFKDMFEKRKKYKEEKKCKQCLRNFITSNDFKERYYLFKEKEKKLDPMSIAKIKKIEESNLGQFQEEPNINNDDDFNKNDININDNNINETHKNEDNNKNANSNILETSNYSINNLSTEHKDLLSEFLKTFDIPAKDNSNTNTISTYSKKSRTSSNKNNNENKIISLYAPNTKHQERRKIRKKIVRYVKSKNKGNSEDEEFPNSNNDKNIAIYKNNSKVRNALVKLDYFIPTTKSPNNSFIRKKLLVEKIENVNLSKRLKFIINKGTRRGRKRRNYISISSNKLEENRILDNETIKDNNQLINNIKERKKDSNNASNDMKDNNLLNNPYTRIIRAKKINIKNNNYNDYTENEDLILLQNELCEDCYVKDKLTRKFEHNCWVHHSCVVFNEKINNKTDFCILPYKLATRLANSMVDLLHNKCTICGCKNKGMVVPCCDRK